MKLSTKCRYGIRAIVEIARNYQVRPTTRKEIAKKQELNDSYLENILIALKASNIVMSTQGPKGGFSLRRAPETITVLQLIEALQGELTLSECLTTPEVCNRVDCCVTRNIWLKVKKAQEDVLGGITIRDLLAEEDAMNVGFEPTSVS